MTLQLDKAVERGLQRVISRSGLVVLLLAIVTQLSVMVSGDAVLSLLVELTPPAQSAALSPAFGDRYPFAPGVAVAALVLCGVWTTAFYLVAARLLARETSALSTVPRTLVTRRFGRAILSGIGFSVLLTLGGIAYVGVVFGVPLLLDRLEFAIFLWLLTLLPMLILAVSLTFTYFAIAVDDDSLMAALHRTWGLAEGDRWQILGLLVVGFGFILAGDIAVSMVTLGVGQVATVVRIVVSAAMVVVSYGLLADAYHQLRREESTGGEVAETTDLAAT